MEECTIVRKIWHRFFSFVWFNKFTFNRFFFLIVFLLNKYNYFRLYAHSNLPTEQLLKTYVNLYLNLEDNEEKKSWVEYLDKILRMPESGEKCVF